MWCNGARVSNVAGNVCSVAKTQSNAPVHYQVLQHIAKSCKRCSGVKKVQKVKVKVYNKMVIGQSFTNFEAWKPMQVLRSRVFDVEWK